MSTVTFYGASGDLVEVDGVEGADEFGAYSSDPLRWHGDLIAPGGTDAMRVYAIYDGCWHFSVGQADEIAPFPEWPVRIRQHTHKDHSVRLEIDVPDGTRLTNIHPTN